jgi:hypothetical protein
MIFDNKNASQHANHFMPHHDNITMLILEERK